MKTTLEQVREAVIKAVPELNVLPLNSFVCDCSSKLIDMVSKTHNSKDGRMPEHALSAMRGIEAHFYGCSRTAAYYAQQHPIRLADVLKTLQPQLSRLRQDEVIVGAYLAFIMFGARWKGSRVAWDFDKDDLSLQSEETLAFLADLLKIN